MLTKTSRDWKLAATALLAISFSPNATRAQDGALAFETEPPRKAADLVSKELLSGSHHKVRADTVPYLFDYSYTIDSDFGVFYAYGAKGLARRVNEINAIASLRELKKTKTFIDAAAKAALNPLNTAKDLVTKPLKTVDGVAKGAVDTGKGVVGGVRDGVRSLIRREKSTKTEYEDGALGELSGYSRTKRTLAAKLGVDPYSSNAVLQRELQGVARTAALGDIGVGAGLAVLTSGVTRTAISATSASSDFRAALVDMTPAEIKAKGKKEMQRLGCSEELIERFVNHVPLLPSQRALLVYGAKKFEGAAGLDSVFVSACRVRDEIEATRFIEALAMLEKEKSAGVRIERLADCGGTVVAITPDGTLLVPMPGTQIAWIPLARRAALSIVACNPAGRAIVGRELLVAGSVTPKAKSGFASNGVTTRKTK